MDKDTIYLESTYLLSFIRPVANNIFNVHNAKGTKLLTRLRVGFSDLKERKF